MAVSEAIERLRDYIDSNDIDAVILNRRSSFAWFSQCENSMNFYTDFGLGYIYVDKNDAFYYTSNNEAPRIEREIFKGSIAVKSFSWVDGPAKNVSKLIKGKKVNADFSFNGVNEDFANIKKLRYSLFDDQINTAIELGKTSASILEKTMKNIKPGLTEYQIEAEIRYAFGKENIELPVLLIACDDNLNVYRHPLATFKIANERFIAVLCPRYKGVVIALSRIVYFRKRTEEEKKRDETICKINNLLMNETNIGMNSKALWDFMVKTYKEENVETEYLNHHQGGAIGFESREWVLRPALEETIYKNQMIAYNPTLIGTKAEETLLILENSKEILTIGKDFPTLTHLGMTSTLPLEK
ncbi:Xaa-Pro peptidase family protein [Brachyspira sp.]|uniref:M24 family metallopeptidase n=1 Tax=Brachyspira sp. TaxID=1977261 RepID=UPI00260201A1|nr:M24 family metallopeptidase [Brachyspira sp.]